MRFRPALAVTLLLGFSSIGLLPAKSPLSLCGGAKAIPLDTNRVLGFLSAPFTLADVDGNGNLEILSADYHGQTHIWKANGKRLKSWPQPGGIWFVFGPPSVGDIDGDGQPDVVSGSYADLSVSAWGSDGGLIPGFPKLLEMNTQLDIMRGAAMLVDLNADAILDVVAGATPAIVHAFTYPFDQEVPGWPVSASFNFQMTPVSTDLDRDGSPEVMISANDLSVVRADGSAFPGWPVSPGAGASQPVSGDLDGDGTPEIIVTASKTLIALLPDGTRRFTATVSDVFSYTDIALGDVTGDGLPEIFVVSNQGRIYGFNGTGGILPGWPVDLGSTEESSRSALVVDLDGDGARDILVQSPNGTLYALGADGTEICPPVPLTGPVIASPAVGDLDGDGFGEVIAATNSGMAVLRLGLPGPWTPSRAAWPMVLANERHTGELP